MRTCLRKDIPLFTSLICSCSSNIRASFTKYSELIACLLVVEQNNELLLKNHQSRSIRSISLLEVNATIQTNKRGPGHGYFYGQGRGRNCGRHISWNQGDYN